MKMNTKILYSLPLAINNGLITVFNSINARFFSSTSLPYLILKWNTFNTINNPRFFYSTVKIIEEKKSFQYRKFSNTDLKLKLNSSSNIKGWVTMYCKDINLINLRPNVIFMNKILLGEFNTSYRYLYHELYYFKNNSLILLKNYSLYLLYTPDNLILDSAIYLIKDYYNYTINYTNKKPKYKYEMISLYLMIGKELVINCLKYQYSNYLKINKIQFFKSGFKTFLKTNQDFIPFVQYKNYIIEKEFYEMNTSDFIEYGRDIYLFITYNIFCINQFERDNSYNINNNSLKLAKVKNTLQKDGLSLINIIEPKIDRYSNFFPSENAILKARESYFGWKRNFYGKKNKRGYNTFISYNRPLISNIYYKPYLYNILNEGFIKNHNKYRFFTTSTFLNQKLNNNMQIETVDSIFNSDVFRSNDIFRLVYNNLINIIENNPINNDTQFKIENYLLNQYKDLAMKKSKVYVSDVDFSLFNKEFKEYCFSKLDEFNHFLDLLRESLNLDKKLNKDVKNLVKNVDIHNYYIKIVMNNLNNEEIISYLFYVLFLVVTYNNMVLKDDDIKEYERTKIGVTDISMNLGKYITNAYISKLYKKNLKDTVLIQDFKEYKDKFLTKDKHYVFNDSEFFLRLSGKLIEILVTCDVININVHDSYNRSLAILKLSNELEKIVNKKNPIGIFPMNLPMIVPAKEYSDKNLGGFLLNNLEYAEPLISSKQGYSIPSVIEEDNIIYTTINGMMKTPFKVNKDLLNYLLKNNHIHKLLINSDYKHEFADIKRTKRQEKEYQEFLSKKTLEKYILLIANIYSNVPEIYFPIKLDNRGRLYPNVAFFHYQGSELAKALILFARPDIIKRNNHNAIEYLKAYGASCYGNGLNRKSYDKRLEWVNNNWDKIINFETSDLVSKADDKFLFLSFCLEMVRFNSFMNNEYLDEFKTYLPIQLDGTCNGYQHLALLSNETEIFDKLNLAESKKNKDPADFYSHILDILSVHLEYKKQNCSEQIKEKLDKKQKYLNDIQIILNKKQNCSEEILDKKLKSLEDEQGKLDEKLKSLDNMKEIIERLLKLGLSRKTIKPIIMNRPYNATTRTLASYVRDLLIFDHVDEELNIEDNQIYDNKGKSKVLYTSWYKIDKNSNNFVKFEDLEFLVKSIDEIVYVKYPKIRMLRDYFHDIGKILNKLNLPIIWRLPNGLMVSQKYMEKHTLIINPFVYISNSLSLSITDKIKINKRKQLTAFMPNLVHSLDATTLTLLYDSLNKSTNYNKNVPINFYSVHDCYGVTAKYVDLLIEMLRTVYIELYSGQGYIEKFDEDIINTIIITYGENVCKYSPEDRTIFINKRKKIVLPDLSEFLNIPNKTRVYKSLSKAIFLVK